MKDRIAFGVAALVVVSILSQRQPDGSWVYQSGAIPVAVSYSFGMLLSVVISFFKE